MPPQLALLVTAGIVIFLLRREARQSVHVSNALWIPLIWVLITGSRFVSQWLGVWGLMPGGAGVPEEGSPLDALVFMGLIAAGFRVLQLRQVKFAVVFRENVWLSTFFIFGFLAVAWSDFPFVAFKRWIKVLGHPIMALVILTDPDPDEAFRRLFKRMAFIMIPSSVLCIKYFPDIGRGFDGWTGQAFNQGINLNKNELGYVCMLTGLFFVWNFLHVGRWADRRARREERLISIVFIVLIAWLLKMADSATSLACWVMGSGVLFILGIRWINKKYLGSYIIAGVLLFGIAESTVGVYSNMVAALGRDATLTDRTEVWKDVLELVEDPVLGTGFESFWLGERREKMWAKWHWQPNQAHNGYIETYLNLGLVGLALLLAVIFATFKKIQRMLLWDFDMGRIRMAYFCIVLAYNFTEATFRGVSLVWLVWHVIALDYPRVLTADHGPGAEGEEEAIAAQAREQDARA